MDLTPHQKKAYREIRKRLRKKEAHTSLKGYAGTGKTYLLAYLVDELAMQGKRVYVCAPTHKAAQVLREKIGDDWITTQTIHAFLGLRLVPDKQGGYRLQPEKGRHLPKEAIVVVDEASMIGVEEWGHITAATGLTWLFAGDPAQLPPVNEEPSPALSVPGPTLEEIVRQAQENPIIQLATEVRSGDRVTWKGQMKQDEGIGVTNNADAFLRSAIRAFESDAFRMDATHARILAYRNRTVSDYNAAVRSAIFEHAEERFVKGEWLIARDTWFNDGIPYLINSEEVRVQKAVEDEDIDLKTGEWKVWRLTVRGRGDFRKRTLPILHESEYARFDEELTHYRKAALKNDKKWDAFYALKERFARVDYAYACTIHKAQGSTFDTAFVDRRDAMVCQGPERQALLYVAVTRPARRLAVLV